MKVVICGGGIIGCSTAYYLTKLGVTDLTIIERHEIAGHASGKAGGFLAQDWCDGGPLKRLARASFQLHQELSRELDASVDFRKLDTLSIRIGNRRVDDETLPAWVDGNVTGCHRIGSTSTTAQVNPKLLTRALVGAAVKAGARILKAEVTSIKVEEDGAVSGVCTKEQGLIECDKLLIAMGPWSSKVCDWLPKCNLPRVRGSRAHSIILEDKDGQVSPHALFLSVNGKDPEVYPRPDGTVYVCGNGDAEQLPEDPSQVLPNEDSCTNLQELVSQVSTALGKSRVMASQACFLPSTAADGLPLIGQVPQYKGAYIATGHSCWGILNGPGTGLAMAEIITKGRSTSVDVSGLEPSRFDRTSK